MIKKPWLVLSPFAFLLGFGFTQNVMASPQLTQTTQCTGCMASNDTANTDAPAADTNSSDNNSDFDSKDSDSDFDNSQDMGQDQSTNASPGTAPDQTQGNGNTTNSTDDGDEN